MASLKNVRHEKFAQCVASGLTGADAYLQVMNYTGKEADGNAANWMNRPGVRERVAEPEGSQFPQGNAERGADNRVPVQCHQHFRR